jgi:hypothetical protein
MTSRPQNALSISADLVGATGFEPVTLRLQGATGSSTAVVGCRVKGQLTALIVWVRRLASPSIWLSAMLDVVVSVQHARLVDELQRPPAISRRPGAQSAAGRVGDHVRTERYRGGR